MRRRWWCWAGVLPGVLALACESTEAPGLEVRFSLGSADLLTDAVDIRVEGFLNASGLSCGDHGEIVGTPPDMASLDDIFLRGVFRRTFPLDAGSWIFHVTMGNDDFRVDGPQPLAEGCATASIEAGSSPQITVVIHDLRREVYCGNGRLDPTPTAGHCPCPTTSCTWYCEECDPPGGACGPDCQFLPDACGNSLVEATETCDDGNTSSGDGCSSDCQTEPFRVNAYEAQAQSLPRVAAGLDVASINDFAVVWADASGRDGAPPGIEIAYYDDAGGRPDGRWEKVVNTTVVTGVQTSPDVAWGRSGFLATFIDQSVASDWNLYAVAYNSSRGLRHPSPEVPEMHVPSAWSGASESQGVVGAHPQWDGFVVVWARGTSPSRKILARTFSGTGDAISGDIQVQATGAADEFLPAVAVAADGSFAVVWVQGTVDTSIQLARFATFDTPVGTITQANNTDAGTQSEPSLAFDSAGRLLVAWNDGSEGSIRARLYPVSGPPAGDFRVSEGALNAGVAEGGRLTTSAAASGVTFLLVWAAQSDGRVMGRLVADAGMFVNNRVTATNAEFLISPDPGSDPATTPVGPSRARVAITPSGIAMVVWQDTEGSTLPLVDPPGGIWGRMFPVP
jgi:cysteine-rich repeat protein